MYVPAEQKTNTDRTNIKDKVGNNQLETFVDGRESTAIQRALIDSIHQSAPRFGAGVVQRTKEEALSKFSCPADMDAQKFMDMLMKVVRNKKLRNAVRRLLTAQQDLARAQQNLRKAQQNLAGVQQNLAGVQQAVEEALRKARLDHFYFLFQRGDPLITIGEFINTWNQGGETDLIDVRSFFQFKDALGEATPTENALARTNPLPTVDTAVTYIGHDDSIDDLDTGILDFIHTQQEGEAVVPQFLTLDLVNKNKVYSEAENEAFITNLTSPYIRICHPEICWELVRNGGRQVGEGNRFGTRKEVNRLLDRGYIFVQPCLLLSQNLRKEGVGVRRLQRMGIDPKVVVDQGWELEPDASGASDNNTVAKPEQLRIMIWGPVGRCGTFSSRSSCGVISQDHKFIAISQRKNMKVKLHDNREVDAIIPQQLIWAFDKRPMPLLELSGMATLKCDIAVAGFSGKSGLLYCTMQVCVALPQGLPPSTGLLEFEFDPQPPIVASSS